MKHPVKIGWVRAMKRYSESTQRAALAEAGVDEMKLYTDREGRMAMLADLGAGGELYVYRLSCLARDRRDFRALVEQIGDYSVTVHEVATERKAALPADLGEMLADAFDDWAGNRMTATEAKRAGKKGAVKRWTGHHRTDIRVAKRIWADTKEYIRIEDALSHPDMEGWTPITAWRLLGKRGTGVQQVKRKPTQKRKR
jgi:DNA invertase Pin-like site-specific DNA recombinase